jgi:hypothetical protein
MASGQHAGRLAAGAPAEDRASPRAGVNPTSATLGLDSFEAERPRLTGLADRITSSLADAEDVVQEAWIRWAARHAATVDSRQRCQPCRSTVGEHLLDRALLPFGAIGPWTR